MVNFTASAWPILVSAALKSTLVLSVAWLLTALLRGRSAATRHLVWTAAASALLALPFLTAGLPALRLPFANAVLPADSGITFRAGTTEAGQTPATHGASRATASAPAANAAAVAPKAPSLDPKSALVLLWMAGILVSLAQMLVAAIALWRTRRSAQPSPDTDLAGSLAGSLGIHTPVQVLETPAAMPMTAGILQPVIFLPRAARSWSLERRRVVLLHELAHVRRGDAATHILARAALALHWWNPLAWTAWRGFIKERECAADDLVLTAGAPATDYAGHLLEIACNFQPQPATAAAALSMARRSQLEGRLISILDASIVRRQSSRTATAAATVFAIALMAPLAAVRAQSQAEQNLPPDVDATILAANAQKSHEILNRAAISYEQLQKFADAQKLREADLAMAANLAGQQSAEYATALVNLGDLAVKRRAIPQAIDYYTQSLAHGDRAENFKALMFLGRDAMKPFHPLPNYLKDQNGNITPAPPPAGQIAISAGSTLAENTPPPASNPPAAGDVRFRDSLRPESQAAGAAVPVPDLDKAYDLLQRARNVAAKGDDSGTAMTWMAMVRQSQPGGASAAEALYRAALAIEEPDTTVQATTLDFFARFLGGNQRKDEAVLMQRQAATIHQARAADLSPKLASSTVTGKVGSGTTPPALLYKVEPEYSEQARAAKFSGTVLLSVVVDTDGAAKDIQVLHALGMGLDEQAVQAVMQWKFKPATKAGRPVAVQAQIEVNFRLM
jgi:TonB family protein